MREQGKGGGKGDRAGARSLADCRCEGGWWGLGSLLPTACNQSGGAHLRDSPLFHSVPKATPMYALFEYPVHIQGKLRSLTGSAEGNWHLEAGPIAF